MTLGNSKEDEIPKGESSELNSDQLDTVTGGSAALPSAEQPKLGLKKILNPNLIVPCV